MFRRCSPTSATSSRSRRASAPSPATSPTSSRWTRPDAAGAGAARRGRRWHGPGEGGALAMAIIEHFRLRGAMVMATTHYDALKTYASTTEGVVPAGFGFDPEDVRADLRLNYGSPGQQPRVRDREPARAARRRSSSGRAHTERAGVAARRALAKVERDMQALEHERRLVARERRDARRDAPPSSRLASWSCATARRRSGSGSTSGSRSGCATRGGKSTQWSTS